MLEYPDNEHDDSTHSDVHFEEPVRRWMLLIQEKVTNGLKSSSNLRDLLGHTLKVIDCTEVFGPYDYVVEFRMPPANRSARWSVPALTRC